MVHAVASPGPSSSRPFSRLIAVGRGDGRVGIMDADAMWERRAGKGRGKRGGRAGAGALRDESAGAGDTWRGCLEAALDGDGGSPGVSGMRGVVGVLGGDAGEGGAGVGSHRRAVSGVGFVSGGDASVVVSGGSDGRVLSWDLCQGLR